MSSRAVMTVIGKDRIGLGVIHVVFYSEQRDSGNCANGF